MMEPLREHEEKTPDFAAWKRSIARLPLTLRPVPNEQLGRWELLFPFEQDKLRGFLEGIDSFPAAELDALTGPLRGLEEKMGVRDWQFSEISNTMENTSELARSAYYAEWRREVRRVSDALAARATRTATTEQGSRLVVLILPKSLPLDRETAWDDWKAKGNEVRISGSAEQMSAHLLRGLRRLAGGANAQQAEGDQADLWLIDADRWLESALPGAQSGVSSISFAALKDFRDEFLAQMNTMPKSLSVADQILTTMRKTDWTQAFAGELAGEKRLQNFLAELFLSGNGAVIFSNAFVEWAASEALRRARPRILVARFGMRSKPKPFTSIAVFENQEKVSTLPDVDDPENSAIDAAMLAHYVWLAANKFHEYEQAVCVCIAEHLNTAWIVAPAGSGIDKLGDTIAGDDLSVAIGKWLG